MSSRTALPTTNAPPRQHAAGRAFLLSALSAVLLAFCFPFASAWWLAWLALAPLYVALLAVRGNPINGAGCGAAFGFVLHLVGCFWMNELGAVPWVGVSVFETGAFAVFGAVAAFALFRLPPVVRPLFFAAAWTMLEYLRTLGAMAFPWFPLAATQVPCLELVQIVAVTGQWGLSFAVAVVNALAVEAFAARRIKDAAMFKLSASAAVGVPILLMVGGGISQSLVATKDTTDADDLSGNTRTVALIQGNVGKIAENADQSDYREIALQTYLQMTRVAVAESRSRRIESVEFVLFPEAVLPGFLLRDPNVFLSVTALARETNTPILAGTEDMDGANHFFNSVVYVDETGAIRHNYAKQRLVPMGEFFPFRAELGNIYEQYQVPNDDLTPGKATGVFDVGIVNKPRQTRVGMLICYEAVFPYISRDRVRGGATLLTQATSDQTFDGTPNPQQHADLCVLRAVETRRWFVRSGATGLTEIIDATGSVRRKLPTGKAGTIVETVVLRTGETFFVRFGDWFAYGCAGLSAAGLVYAGARRNIRRNDSGGTPSD